MGVWSCIKEKIKNSFESTASEFDDKYKQMGFFDKVIQHYSIPALKTSATLTLIAAPVLYFLLELGHYYGKQEYATEVTAKTSAVIKNYEQQYLLQQDEIISKQTQVLTAQDLLKSKEAELQGLEERLGRFEARLKFEREGIELSEKNVELDKDIIGHEKKAWEEQERTLRACLEHDKNAFDKMKAQSEEQFERMAQALNDSARDKAKTSLVFVQGHDVNKNYVPDDADSEVSRSLLGGISILSQQYMSSVMSVHNPEVLKKLAGYNLEGSVLCVNDNTLVVYDKDKIKRTITGVPEELLHDFQANPKGKAGLEQIMECKKAGPCEPVVIKHPYFDLEGSGFILGNRYIATAYHVVEDLDEIELKFNNGKKILTKKDDCLVAYSKERDIALLKLDFDGYSPVCIEENLSVNDPVYFNRPVSGSNFQQGSKVEGVLNSIESMAFYSLINKDKNAPGPGIIGTNLYLATLQALRGDSGSAVLDKNGCVVGVASSIHSHALGATCIVQAKYLKKLLEFYSKKAE